MVDWTKTMEQTFEYYEVDPKTWKDKKKLENIISSSISRDSTADTLGSASINLTNMLGESYIRIYVLIIQNGNKYRFPLGTYLVQTPKSSFDGRYTSVSVDAYSPLIELKEKPVPLGFTLLKNENILNNAYLIAKDNCRCPVIKTTSPKTLNSNFVANSEDNYMTFLRDLLYNAEYSFDIDEMGKVMFKPIQKTDSLQPVYTFSDDNSSILYPAISLTHDIYGIPNVVEIYCTVGNDVLYSVARNEDPNSPTSIQARGRELIYRNTNPSINGIPTQEILDEYAKNILEEASSVDYTITFSHGYYPCRPGDCVRLNYKKAGIENIKAKIISQSISCKQGLEVKTTATFTKKLWK